MHKHKYLISPFQKRVPAIRTRSLPKVLHPREELVLQVTKEFYIVFILSPLFPERSVNKYDSSNSPNVFQPPQVSNQKGCITKILYSLQKTFPIP